MSNINSSHFIYSIKMYQHQLDDEYRSSDSVRKRNAKEFSFIFFMILFFEICISLSCKLPSNQPSWRWESLGIVSDSSAGEIWETYSPTSIAISPVDNCPVIAFRDGSTIRVMRISTGLTCTDLGSPGVGTYPAITVDPSDGKPIVVFSGNARVMKWVEGTDWESLGSAGPGTSTLFNSIV